jgi:hypothetical protein
VTQVADAACAADDAANRPGGDKLVRMNNPQTKYSPGTLHPYGEPLEPPPEPDVHPIQALFTQSLRHTTYSIFAKPDPLSYAWTLDPPSDDPKGCTNAGELTSTADVFVWYHGDDQCTHEVEDPNPQLTDAENGDLAATIRDLHEPVEEGGDPVRALGRLLAGEELVGDRDPVVRRRRRDRADGRIRVVVVGRVERGEVVDEAAGEARVDDQLEVHLRERLPVGHLADVAADDVPDVLRRGAGSP